MRAEAGCDRPATKPVFHITCGACGGRNSECTSCDGEGNRPMFRCPLKLLGEHFDLSHRVEHAVRLFTAYVQHGLLPAANGLEGMPASLWRAFEICGGERSRIDAELEEERQSAARAAQRLTSNKGGGRRTRRG